MISNGRQLVALVLVVGLILVAVIGVPIALVTHNGNVRVQACQSIRSETARVECIDPPVGPVDQCSKGAQVAGNNGQPFPWGQCIADLGRAGR